MNQKNFDYLKDQVKFTGFGEGLEAKLKEKIEQGQPAFTLQHQAEFGKDKVDVVLQFSQSKQSDMYFFNAYQATLKKDNSEDSMTQTFYINKGSNITLKEAYNLMDGRAINKDLTSKEGNVYNAWVQMDFKQSDNNGNFKHKHYHENYGFNLEAVLAKHPIKELEDSTKKTELIDSLKKGNLQSVTFRLDDKEQKRYIEAAPQFKTIHIYDERKEKLDQRQAKREGETAGEAVKEDNKKLRQTPADDEGPEVPKQKPRRRRQTPST